MGVQHLDSAPRQCPSTRSPQCQAVPGHQQVTILDHPPYSPDLTPCDYFLFPKLKGTIKGTRFEGVEDIKSNVTSFLKRITKEDFAECFQAWRRRMEKCTEVQGDYFEGNN